MENTTITISKELAKKLWIAKKDLDAKTLEEVIDRILKVIPASELKVLENKK